jgi:hypothetical protein
MSANVYVFQVSQLCKHKISNAVLLRDNYLKHKESLCATIAVYNRTDATFHILPFLGIKLPIKIFLPHSATSRVLGERRRPDLKYRGCPNMQPHQSYLLPHGEVMDECRALVEWLLTSESRRNRKNLLQCQLVHQESLTRSLGTGSRCEKPGDSPLELWNGV